MAQNLLCDVYQRAVGSVEEGNQFSQRGEISEDLLIKLGKSAEKKISDLKKMSESKKHIANGNNNNVSSPLQNPLASPSNSPENRDIVSPDNSSSLNSSPLNYPNSSIRAQLIQSPSKANDSSPQKLFVGFEPQSNQGVGGLQPPKKMDYRKWKSENFEKNQVLMKNDSKKSSKTTNADDEATRDKTISESLEKSIDNSLPSPQNNLPTPNSDSSSISVFSPGVDPRFFLKDLKRRRTLPSPSTSSMNAKSEISPGEGLFLRDEYDERKRREEVIKKTAIPTFQAMEEDAGKVFSSNSQSSSSSAAFDPDAHSVECDDGSKLSFSEINNNKIQMSNLLGKKYQGLFPLPQSSCKKIDMDSGKKSEKETSANTNLVTAENLENLSEENSNSVSISSQDQKTPVVDLSPDELQKILQAQFEAEGNMSVSEEKIMIPLPGVENNENTTSANDSNSRPPSPMEMEILENLKREMIEEELNRQLAAEQNGANVEIRDLLKEEEMRENEKAMPKVYKDLLNDDNGNSTISICENPLNFDSLIASDFGFRALDGMLKVYSLAMHYGKAGSKKKKKKSLKKNTSAVIAIENVLVLDGPEEAIELGPEEYSLSDPED